MCDKFLDMNRTDYIPATCVLHNICLDSNDLESENYIQEEVNYVQANNIDNHKRNDLCRQNKI